MRKASIFVVAVVSIGLVSCAQGNFSGDPLLGSVASTSSQEQTKPDRYSQKKQETARKPRKKRSIKGKVIGGVSASKFAGNLNDADQKAAAEAEYRALEFGKPGVATPWRNPQNGRYGNVVASKPFKQKNIYCRQYTHTIYLNGRPEILRGIACRNRDKSWQNLG